MLNKIQKQLSKLNKLENELENEMDKLKSLITPFMPENLEFEIILQTDGFCILLQINKGTNIPISNLLPFLTKKITIDELLKLSI